MELLPSVTIGGKEISLYMVMTLLGGFAMAAVVFGMAKRGNYRKDQLLHIMLSGAAGAFIGGHFLFFFTRLSLLRTVAGNFTYYVQSVSDFLTLLRQLFGGMVFYGGLFGAIAGGVLYCRSLKLDPQLYLDLFAPSIPLFHAFARVGCLCAGCCFGVESEYGWYFPYSPIADHTTRYFPIQLVEAACNVLLFLLLLWLSKRNVPKGRLIFVYFSLYASVRFTLEFWRGDTVRGIYGGLSTSQWISLALLIVSAAVLWHDKQKALKKTSVCANKTEQ